MQAKIVYDLLKQLDITFDIVEHPPALTTADADRFIQYADGVRTKSLFLCNRKNTSYYLIVVEAAKRLDIKKLDLLLGERGLHFCSEEKLKSKMSLYPGAVSLFGIINNAERDIKLYFDRDVLSGGKITFHPNDNTKTVFIEIEDMFKFITSLGYEYNVLDI